MKIDLKLINKEQFRCTEKIIATIGMHFKRGYEMIFANKWQKGDFSLPEDIDEVFITPEVAELFAKFHGIEIIISELENPETAMEFIKSELSKGRPVALPFDELYAPWILNIDENKNERYYGILIINGIIDNQELLCIDIHQSQKQEILPISHFNKGFFNKHIISFKELDKKDDFSDCFKYIKTSAQALLQNEGNAPNLFDQYRMFADRLRNASNDPEAGYSNRLHELSKLLKKIFLTKYLYSLSIKYVANGINNLELSNLSYQFDEIVSNWSMVFLIATKMNVMKNNDNIGNIADIITDTSNKEEHLAKALSDLNIDSLLKSDISDCNKYCNRDESKYYFIDITGYCNNKGFIFNSEPFIGNMGLPVDDIIKSGSLNLDNYKFLLSENACNEKPDSIYCESQIIKINVPNAKVIQILGCSGCNNFSGIAKLVYNDGFVEHISMAFSSHIQKKSYDYEYEENVVMWKGISLMDKEVRLYANQYILHHNGDLKELILPDNNYIDIFAITVIQ